MTGYGESITQKEILLDSYLVIPESMDDSSKSNTIENANVDWETVSPKKHTLTFKEFHFSHHIINEAVLIRNNFYSTNDLVIMQFCLSGSYTVSKEKSIDGINFKPSEHNVILIPKNTDLLVTYEGHPFELISIYFDKTFLLKYIPTNHLLIDKINSGSFEVMTKENLSLSPKIQGVIQDIVNCGFDGHLKKLYTQAKLIELLTLQLAQLEEEKSEPSTVLKQSDIDKMMIVKEIITSDYKESFSLSYLARAAGTNEQYLKKNFKILFGSTVFNYILACKMEKAKELLLQGEYKIADVADLTGYKHATHFTSAFKKFFGYLPQKIKGKLEDYHNKNNLSKSI